MRGAAILTFNIDRLGSGGTDGENHASCFYTVNATQDEHAPCMMNWHGMQQVKNALTGEKYPMLNSVPYDAFGASLAGYALSWDFPYTFLGSAGLYTMWWQAMVTELAGAIEIEYRVQLDALSLNNIDWNNNVLTIHGLRYLCKKASIVMPVPEVATLTLVRV